MELLQDKTLVMVIGPAAVGKSSLMRAVTGLDSSFGYVHSFTTRPPRKNETSSYTHITESEAQRLHEQGGTVTFAKHPTTGNIYGTTSGSYTAKYNLLDTLSSTVTMYKALPFKQTIAISVTTDPEAWTTWLLERYPTASDERTKRLKEAISSIEWSLNQTTNHSWLVNTPDNLEQTASQLIEMVLGNKLSAQTPQEALKLLEQAKSLLSYK